MKIVGWKVYIKPFDDSGVYTDWIDVTEDVDQSSLGQISQQLDNTDYDFGVYRNSSMTLTMRNDHGRYSDIDVQQSIFRTKRSNSLCRITFDLDPNDAILGDAILGDAYLSYETDVFVGLLSDEALVMDLDKLSVSFQLLGRESVFTQVNVPNTIANGDNLSAIVYACLNQPLITGILNIDPANINLGIDEASDDVSSLVDATTAATASDAIDEILRISNSILYISGDDVIVAPRTPSVDVKKTFFGQASLLGPEDIVNIQGIKTGLSRTFNYLTWDNGAGVAQSADSIALYGIRSNTVSSSLITDTTKQNNLLAQLITEFGFPKQEFQLTTPISYETLALNLLDRVAIDYPTVFVSVKEGIPLPVCGQAICGEAVLPRGLWAFTIDTTKNQKIIGKKIDAKTGNITFQLRGI